MRSTIRASFELLVCHRAVKGIKGNLVYFCFNSSIRLLVSFYVDFSLSIIDFVLSEIKIISKYSQRDILYI